MPESNFMLVLGLVATRIFVALNLIPFLFGSPAPAMIRSGATVALVLVIYPAIVPMIPPEALADRAYVLVLFFKEAFYGVAIGLAATFFFYAMDAAGQIVDNQRGASMAQVFSPLNNQPVTTFGAFSFQLGIVLFLSIGGHRLFFDSFLMSYQRLPIHELPTHQPDMLAMMDHFISISGAVLVLAAQLAAPVIITIFVVDMVLGIMNRISPAVNVMDMGFLIRGVAGAMVFFLAITVIADQMKLITMETVENVEKTIRYLSGPAT